MLTSCKLYPVWLESSCSCVIYSIGFRAVSLATFSTSVCMNRADMTRYCNAWRKEGIWWWSLVCCPQDSPVDSKQEHLIKNQGMTACHLLSPLAWLMRKPLQQPGPETFLCFHKHQEQEERSLTSCHTVTTGQWMLPGPVVYVLPLLSLYLYLLQPSSAGANCLFALVYWTRGDTWRLEYNVQDRAALCYSRSFFGLSIVEGNKGSGSVFEGYRFLFSAVMSPPGPVQAC